MNLGHRAKIVLSVLVLVALLGFAATPYFCIPAANSAYFALTLFGIVIICLRLTPTLRSVLWIATAGAVVAVEVHFFIHPFSPDAWISSVGFGSLIILSMQALWADERRRDQALWGFAGAAFLVISEYFGLNLLMITENPASKVLDLYLISFESSLRIPVGFLVGQAFQKQTWLHLTGLFCYVGLFIPVAVVYAGQLVHGRQKALESLAAFIIAAPIGFIFYRIFPAIGPAAAFQGNFPWHPLSYSDASRLVVMPILGAGLRNAMPSLHMTWMLLAWWGSRGLPLWERSVAIFFTVFTVVATMGTGEHYLIDLIVAFPFALMIQYLCAYSLPWRNDERARPFLFGFLVTVAWLVVLRYEPRVFWISPIVPWAGCILTVVLSILSMKRSWQLTPATTPAVVRQTPA